eukprot:CAMPEP_0197705076 /NCGR_PEP_ID=MMETSP1338-20131121/126259_1 /TAXON_ID=43686 ORGANISM="Pelagodinium beii, Strain RCC1491" /NCGR_SAMPLE_ID=MMETSP1338 /ASSEMBLY_ACC=CAM_ASM_000754 /LENGTH=308 /DNA_ID=CAMNT_0043288981 /DNA_START=64 /DNA_END=990 /DNA_ORIENTATION=+
MAGQNDGQANFAALSKDMMKERLQQLTPSESFKQHVGTEKLAEKLAKYHAKHPRRVTQCRAPLLPQKDYRDLLELLDSMSWEKYNAQNSKYVAGRKLAIRAVAAGSQNFVLGATLGPAGSKGFDRRGPKKGVGKNTVIVKNRQARDKATCMKLWNTMKGLIKGIDPDYMFTSIQVNRNFSGKPHRDRNDRSYQYALSLGDFSGGALTVETDDPEQCDRNDRSYQYALSLGDFSGGALTVETDDPEQLVQLDTKGRLTKCDGRRAHWVSPYAGKRYSLIMYRNLGKVTPVLSNRKRDTNARGVGEKRKR